MGTAASPRGTRGHVSMASQAVVNRPFEEDTSGEAINRDQRAAPPAAVATALTADGEGPQRPAAVVPASTLQRLGDGPHPRATAGPLSARPSPEPMCGPARPPASGEDPHHQHPLLSSA